MLVDKSWFLNSRLTSTGNADIFHMRADIYVSIEKDERELVRGVAAVFCNSRPFHTC